MGSLHARVISQSDRASLAWVADPNQQTGEVVANKVGAKWLAKLDPTDVDAIVIAAATEVHTGLALEAIEAGKPLLVEKPLADSLEEAALIVSASKSRGLPLVCGFLERFNPAILTAQQFIERPSHASAIRHSPYVSRIRTGVASDLLIHDLDMMIRLFDATPISASGTLGSFHPESAPGAEDVADAIVTFSNGGVASASASRLSQRKVRTLVINELDRQIELDLVRQDITIYRHVTNAAADESTGLGYRQQTVIDIPVIQHQREPLAAQLDMFLDLIDGIGDIDRERSRILPPHELLHQVRFGGTVEASID